jgi:hypothetical protein
VKRKPNIKNIALVVAENWAITLILFTYVLPYVFHIPLQNDLFLKFSAYSTLLLAVNIVKTCMQIMKKDPQWKWLPWLSPVTYFIILVSVIVSILWMPVQTLRENYEDWRNPLHREIKILRSKVSELQRRLTLPETLLNEGVSARVQKTITEAEMLIEKKRKIGRGTAARIAALKQESSVQETVALVDDTRERIDHFRKLEQAEFDARSELRE